MKKSNIIKAIGGCVAFLISASATYFIVSPSNIEVPPDTTDNKPVVSDSIGTHNVVISDTSKVIAQQDTVKPDSIKVIKPEPEVVLLKSHAPVYNSTSNSYSFTAYVVGNVKDPYHYELWSINVKKLTAKSEDGKFTNIPPVKGGRYKLYLVSDKTGENIVKPISVKGFDVVKEPNNNPDTDKLKEKPKKITEEEFQKRMLDTKDRTLDGGRKSPVSKTFKVIVVNANSDESDFGVSDIQDVRDMIHTYNKWKSARVVELEYDDKGYVTIAKIEAIY